MGPKHNYREERSEVGITTICVGSSGALNLYKEDAFWEMVLELD